MCAQILPLGFESIEPFFWQTIGDTDIPRLAGELREAIGDRDVAIDTLGMFGNPLEDGDIDLAATLAELGGADRQRASLRREDDRRLHRPRPRPADRGQPAALHVTCWASSPGAPPTRACASPSRTAPWTATGQRATGTSRTIPMPGS